MMDLDETFDTLVLGIGNLLWADEGFGVRVVEEMHRRFVFPPSVKLMDGGTQGLYLVQFVRQAKNLLVFDAIDYGDEPGSLRLVLDAEVPRFMGAKKMSLHQTGFQEVISAAELMGGAPAAMALIGVQAQELEDWGGSLRPLIRDRIEPAIAMGLKILHDWGIDPVRRDSPLPADQELVGHDMDIRGYERTAAPTASASQGHPLQAQSSQESA